MVGYADDCWSLEKYDEAVRKRWAADANDPKLLKKAIIDFQNGPVLKTLLRHPAGTTFSGGSSSSSSSGGGGGKKRDSSTALGGPPRVSSNASGPASARGGKSSGKNKAKKSFGGGGGPVRATCGGASLGQLATDPLLGPSTSAHSSCNTRVLSSLSARRPSPTSTAPHTHLTSTSNQASRIISQQVTEPSLSSSSTSQPRLDAASTGENGAHDLDWLRDYEHLDGDTNRGVIDLGTAAQQVSERLAPRLRTPEADVARTLRQRLPQPCAPL